MQRFERSVFLQGLRQQCCSGVADLVAGEDKPSKSGVDTQRRSHLRRAPAVDFVVREVKTDEGGIDGECGPQFRCALAADAVAQKPVAQAKFRQNTVDRKRLAHACGTFVADAFHTIPAGLELREVRIILTQPPVHGGQGRL